MSLPPALASLLPHITTVLAGLLAAGGGTFGYLKLRKGAKAPAAPEPQPPTTPQAAPPITAPVARDRLVALMDRFFAGLPDSIRDSARYYPVLLVLGPTGAGKTELVEEHLDWPGQARQFRPSLVDDPLLQVYMGDERVVVELSFPLLTDSSDATRRSLMNLFGYLSTTQTPQVVVVLDGATVSRAVPDALHELAQHIRGKVELLAEVCPPPLSIRLCLTHCEQLTGFVDLAAFVRARTLPAEFPLAELLPTEPPAIPLTASPPTAPLPADAPTPSGMARVFAPYERHLPQLMTTLPIGALRGVVDFLSNSERTLIHLPEFLRTLADPKTRPRITELERLVLCASPAELTLGEAFRVRPQERDPYVAHRRRHRRIGALVLLVGLIWPLAMLLWQHARLEDAEERVAALASLVRTQPSSTSRPPSARHAATAAAKAVQAADLRVLWPPLGLSFTGRKLDLKQRLVKSLRALYFLPPIGGGAADPDGRHAAYGLAALYAAEDTELGEMIAAHPAEVAAVLDVPPETIRDYVRFSAEPYGEPSRLSPPSTRSGRDGSEDPLLGWRTFLEQTERQIHAPATQPAQLAALRTESCRRLAALAQAERFALGPRLVELLHPYLSTGQRNWLTHNGEPLPALRFELANSEPLRDLLTILCETHPALPQLDRMSLAELTEQLDALLATRARPQPAPADPPVRPDGGTTAPLDGGTAPDGGAPTRAAAAKAPPDPIVIAARGRRYTFPRRAIAQMWARALIGSYQSAGRSPFAEGAKGRYTRATLDNDVLPSLLRFARSLEEDGLSAEAKEALLRYVQKASQHYAQGYRADLLARLARITASETRRWAAESAQTVALALEQAGGPDSSLVKELAELADDIPVIPAEPALLKPLADGLALFKPLKRLLTAKDGEYPELAKYQQLLTQLAAELEQPTAGDKEGAAKQLADKLAPIGQIALAALLDTEASYPRKLEAVLAQAGLADSLRGPFRPGVDRVIRLGQRDIAKVVSQEWQRAKRHYVRPVFERYPFAREAKRDLSVASLETIRPPEGAFWQFFESTAAPLCTETDGVFTQRRTAHGTIALPADLLPVTNRLAAVARMLWDPSGTRQPIQLTLSPQPLPIASTRHAVPAIMASLRVGASQVVGFNQKPEPRALSVPWWEPAPIELRVRVAQNRDDQSERRLEIPASLWSLQRLFDRATRSGTNTVTWAVPESEAEQWRPAFTVEGDPLAPFRGDPTSSAQPDPEPEPEPGPGPGGAQ